MPIEFRCPNCERLLRTSDDKAGATAKCPQCGSAVEVPAAAKTQPADQTVEMTGSSDIAEREIGCPMCGQPNLASASHCLACGEELPLAGQGDDFTAENSQRFRSIWREAWKKWTANIGISAAAALIAGGLLFGVYLFLLLVTMVVSYGMFSAAAARGGGAADAAFWTLTLLIATGYLLFFAVYAYLLVGFANFSLRMTRWREAPLGSMFPSVGTGVSSMVSTFFVMLALVVSTIPGMGLYAYGISEPFDSDWVTITLAVGGYLVMFLGWGLCWAFFWPVHYAIAEGMGSFAALARGVRIALANPLLSFLLALTHTGLLLGGFLTCYVGLLFAVPLSFVLFAVAYNRCTRPIVAG